MEGNSLSNSHKYGKFISKLVGPAGTAFERDLYAFPELQIRKLSISKACL